MALKYRLEIRAAFLSLLLSAALAGSAGALPPTGREPLADHGCVLPRSLTRGKIEVVVAREMPETAAINGSPLSAAAKSGDYVVFFLVLPVDYARDTAQLSLTSAGRTLDRIIPVLPHENASVGVSSIVLTGDKTQITADKKNQERLAAEDKKVGLALAARSAQQFTLPFVYPLAEPVITSGFGKKRNYYDTGKKFLYSSYHLGLDMKAKKGTMVMSAADGTVLLAEATLVRGNCVFVDHGLGVITGYYHLDQLLVKAGERIGRGAPLGTAGTTGLSTGVHLHWSVIIGGVNADGVSLIEVGARVEEAGALLAQEASRGVTNTAAQ